MAQQIYAVIVTIALLCCVLPGIQATYQPSLRFVHEPNYQTHFQERENYCHELLTVDRVKSITRNMCFKSSQSLLYFLVTRAFSLCCTLTVCYNGPMPACVDAGNITF